MSTQSTARAWMEVSGSALRRNLERVRGRVGNAVPVIAMVKADAYGLGVAKTVRALRGTEVSAFGVATVAEGVELRALGVMEPVIVFSPVSPGALGEGVKADLSFALSDVEAARRLGALARESGRVVEVHLEIDTGMGRAGADPAGAAEILRMCGVEGGGAGSLRLAGIFTHFHSAEEDPDSVPEQLRRFDAVVGALPVPEGLPFGLHLCNSAGALLHPELARGAVRPGIVLYGGIEGSEPVVAVRARIGLIREVEAGTTAGYGATYRARERERWATVTIGYGDGLPRALAHGGEALVAGRRAPILGRISMDMTVVDISDLPDVSWGDVVTFVGSDGDEVIPLAEVARRAGTIPYEILTGFTPRLPRRWEVEEDG